MTGCIPLPTHGELHAFRHTGRDIDRDHLVVAHDSFTIALAYISWQRSCPSPPQVGQVVCVCICPRIVLAIRVTTPLPLHVSHVFDTLRSSFRPATVTIANKATYFFTLIFFSTPVAISFRFNFTFTRKIRTTIHPATAT